MLRVCDAQGLKDGVRRAFNSRALSCRPLTKEGFRQELRMRLCGRDGRGNPPAEETAVPSTDRQVRTRDRDWLGKSQG